MIFKLINFFCISQKALTKPLHTAVARFSKPSVVMANASGLELKKVLDVLETFAPKDLSENWDNTGLLVEPYTPRRIKQILLTNDLTEDVVLEARSVGCELIISYHPPIFAPLKSVTQKSWKEKVVSMLLEGGVALYSPHTSWDSVRGGVNDWLASCFPFLSSDPILPGPAPQLGGGRLLKLQHPVTIEDAVNRVKSLTGLSHVRLAVARGRDLSSELSTVALCAGSGASVLKGVSADLYLTGEMLHHDVLDATQRGVSVLLTNHSDSERGFLHTLSPKLTELLDGQAAVFVSSCDRDPLVTL